MQSAADALKEYLEQLKKDNPLEVVKADVEGESEAAKQLRRGLRFCVTSHTMSIAQCVGIYPA